MASKRHCISLGHLISRSHLGGGSSAPSSGLKEKSKESSQQSLGNIPMGKTVAQPARTAVLGKEARTCSMRVGKLILRVPLVVLGWESDRIKLL